MPNWCHNTLTVTGPEAELRAFVEKVKTDEQPLSFTAIVPQPSDEELRKRETYRPCTMCGAAGTLPETEAQASERGAKWFPWMDPAERAAHFSAEALAAGEDRRCNVCRGSGEERIGMEGWYSWRCEAWGTKWDASFDGPFLALGYDGADVDTSVEAHGDTITPTVAIYKFDTAWSPPVPVMVAASEQHPELEFVLRYGEPGEGYAGEVKIVSGLVIHNEELDIHDVLAAEEMWF